MYYLDELPGLGPDEDLDKLPHSKILLLTFSTRLCKNFKFLTKYGIIQTELNFRLVFLLPCRLESSSTSMCSSESFKRKMSTMAPAAASSQAPESPFPVCESWWYISLISMVEILKFHSSRFSKIFVKMRRWLVASSATSKSGHVLCCMHIMRRSF